MCAKSSMTWNSVNERSWCWISLLQRHQSMSNVRNNECSSVFLWAMINLQAQHYVTPCIHLPPNSAFPFAQTCLKTFVVSVWFYRNLFEKEKTNYGSRCEGIEKKQKHFVYFHWSQNQKEKETEKWDISPSLSQNLSRASFFLSRESIYAFIYKPASSICSGKQTIC